MFNRDAIVLRRGDKRRGRLLSSSALDHQRHEVQDLLLKERRFLLPDAIFRVDQRRAAERVLVAELWEDDHYRIVGYVSWDIRCVTYYDVTRKKDISCTLVVLRSLVVHEDFQHSMIALRLSREAEFLGTVEAHEMCDGFPAIGTVGFIQADNEIALGWAERLGWRVRLHGVDDLELASHPSAECVVLLGLELARQVQNAPFVMAFVNRLELIDAAMLHLIGTLPREVREEIEPNGIAYDIPGLLGRHALRLARDIVREDPETMNSYALNGGRDDTLFGPLPRSEMMRGIGENPEPPLPIAAKRTPRRKAA